MIPAIDVLDGRVVRLLRGDFAQVTVYSDDPVEFAFQWAAEGASRIHVVDLNGARRGAESPALIERMAAAPIPVQVGGGIRTAHAARAMIAAGADRVVVGTTAVERPDVLHQIAEEVGPEAVVVALDVRGGRALGSGWLDAGRSLARTVASVIAVGAGRALVTGINRDGTMEGPDLELLDEVRAAAPLLRIVASGGVGSLADVKALADAEANIEAVVVGQALYQGVFRLDEAIQTAGQ